MIGFKIVDKHDSKYEVGKTYEEELIRFFTIPIIALEDINDDDNSKYLLVEALGETELSYDRLYTKKLRIIKEVNRDIFYQESLHIPFIEEYKKIEKNNDPENIILTNICKLGFLNMVKSLIYANQKDGDKYLMISIEHGHLEIVKYLIEDCMLDYRTNRLDYILATIKYRQYHFDILKYLIEEQNCGKPHVELEKALLLAVEYGHLEVVKYLIEEHNCDPHASDPWTKELPLLFAIHWSHLEVTKYLIEEQNCDPHSESALRWALEDSKIEIVKYLIEDCNVNISDPLFSIKCSAQNSQEVFEYLINKFYQKK